MSELTTDLLSEEKVRFLSTADLGISFDEQESIPGPSVTLSLPADPSPRNRIFFGSPGSGKSRAVRIITKGHLAYAATFHPDYEYTDFVGAYKPVEDEARPGNITYKFEPGVLTNAYVEAWTNPGKRVYVVIEEINRGNCAQIFGDMFLLLDRDGQNFSDYLLSVHSSLSRHLKQALAGTDYADRVAELYEAKQGLACEDPFSVMAFPPNLYLYATMNTSDQSLFPMDSAFRRRWDWEYVPIDYADADQITIDLGNGFTYSWGQFIERVNRHIVSLTGSEDKQLGNRFVNPPDEIIALNVFKSKVMFYLWSEIYKHEHDRSTSIFIYQPAATADLTLFAFSKLYEFQADGTPFDTVILPSFMQQLGLKLIEE